MQKKVGRKYFVNFNYLQDMFNLNFNPHNVGGIAKKMLGLVIIFFEPYVNSYSYGQNSFERIPKLKHSRVLIIGSGPSAENLNVPDNVSIFCCNNSFLKLKQSEKIDIYNTNKYSLSENPKNLQRLKQANIKTLLLDKESSRLVVSEGRKLIYSTKNIRIFDPLVASDLYSQRLSFYLKDQRYFPSTGVNLILLALKLGAKEVYISGIEADDLVTYASDLDYSPDQNLKKNHHLLADLFVLNYLKNNKLPVFSVKKQSRLAELIGYKEL